MKFQRRPSLGLVENTVVGKQEKAKVLSKYPRKEWEQNWPCSFIFNEHGSIWTQTEKVRNSSFLFNQCTKLGKWTSMEYRQRKFVPKKRRIWCRGWRRWRWILTSKFWRERCDWRQATSQKKRLVPFSFFGWEEYCISIWIIYYLEFFLLIFIARTPFS